MPSGDTAKNRLPYLNLLFLALVLSGGGFFCYTSYQQRLFEQLDSQLYDTVMSSVYSEGLPSEGTPDIDPLCQKMAVSHDQIALALYSPQGQLICASAARPEWPELHQTQSSGFKTQTQSFQGKNFRTLSAPLVHRSRVLVLNSRIATAQLEKHLTLTATVIFVSALTLLALFYWLQQKQTGNKQLMINKLIALIENSDADEEIPGLKLESNASEEEKKLADSYNTLMNQLSDNLRRSRQFAANVTHELRTPLTILRGETELALRNNRSREQLQQILESNLEEISRMSYLIEDLLLLSKSDLGEIPLKMESLDLSGLTMELHHQGQLLANAKQINFSLDLPDDQIIIQADSLRLRQVLLNLITNAIKYTPDNGHASIALRQENRHIKITICDSGIGIAQEHLDRIFERFYRINKVHNRNDGGSGLGLAIVKWIVDAHNGKIAVTSTPGQGSCFTVIIPSEQ